MFAAAVRRKASCKVLLGREGGDAAVLEEEEQHTHRSVFWTSEKKK